MANVLSLYEQAIGELRSLMEDARRRGDRECSTAALATATRDARPSVRTVGVVRLSTAGLAIFANADTGKGRQMLENPRASLCFHWPVLQYQVIVEGAVALLPEDEADALWLKQPREFSLGHWASDQTHAAEEPAQIRENVRVHRQRFDFERIPRPPAWRAFEIRPDRIDLWPTGWTHLRPRRRYLKTADGGWTLTRDNP